MHCFIVFKYLEFQLQNVKKKSFDVTTCYCFTAYPGQYNQQPGGYPAQPQPQYGYGGQQSSATVVVTGQPTVLIQQFREAPVRTQCPSCRADILTSTHYETGTMTWVVAGVLCFVG